MIKDSICIRAILCAGVFCFSCHTPYAQNVNENMSSQSITGNAFKIHSIVQNEDRTIVVYLPRSYNEGSRAYPVMYVLDGEVMGLTTTSAANFLANNVTVPLIPEVVIVSIHNNDRNRDMPRPQEYKLGNPQSPETQFLKFLVSELAPAVESKYRVNQLRILVGHSQGGLFAHFAFTKYPDSFGWIISLDAPLHGFEQSRPIMDSTIAILSQGRSSRKRLASVESIYGWKDQWPTKFKSKESCKCERIVIQSETHESMVYSGVYQGLKSLFSDYASYSSTDKWLVYTYTLLKERYDQLSEQYGYFVEIPEQLLLQSASEQIALFHGLEAQELIDSCEALYGATAFTRGMRIDAEDAIQHGRDSRFEEWARLPEVSAKEITPFLGVWESKAQSGLLTTITIKTKAELAEFSFLSEPPGGTAFSLDIAFVKVSRGQTLEFGLRNGKGPGIILKTLKLTSKRTMNGISETVGIPHAPPPFEIIYVKKS